MKKLFLLILLAIPTVSLAQKGALSKLLWKRVHPCYEQIEKEERGKLDTAFAKVIDDAKNGYLYLSGGWPTCGCECTSTVGAYKNTKGKYTLLQLDSENCGWVRKVSSNRTLSKVLPKGFGIESFASKKIKNTLITPAFIVTFDIPRKGTDTKAHLELIPFGLLPKGKNALCYAYSEKSPHRSLFGIESIAKETKLESTLDCILEGSFDKITKEDRGVIDEYIDGDDSRKFASLKVLQQELKRLKKVYDIYNSLETDTLTLGWDRKVSRFFIKSKGKKITKMSFKDFLIEGIYWDFMC